VSVGDDDCTTSEPEEHCIQLARTVRCEEEVSVLF
jgi:hypothetical protein